MAKNTNIELRNEFIYQVFIRQHTVEGTFNAFVKDLDRIKDLGVTLIHLLPIHPIGKENRKGTLGSPYSISDYKGINPEYGTLEDFKNLIEECHNRDIKVMIDVVYNHTSYDSVLINKHPEWFYKNEQGEFANRVGDWWDITDLDYNEDLENYLIGCLKYWKDLGVDGYRCDVASLVSIDFWLKARSELSEDTIWLTESVHGHFLKEFRDLGFAGYSECEMYQAFDLSYDYDIHVEFEKYLKGEGTFKEYLTAYKKQMEIYPKNFVKMRNLENHDFGRIAAMVDGDMDKILMWTAISFFQFGCTLIYAGQEYCDMNRPSLFDIDKVNWDENKDISDFVKHLNRVTNGDVFTSGIHNITINNQDVFVGEYILNDEKIVGIFNVRLENQEVNVKLPSSTYTNIIDNDLIEVSDNKILLSKKPIIIKTTV